jgi:hypothetical protein
MPSQAMQGFIDAFRDEQKASANRTQPTLEERRAAFAPAGRLQPVPDDVLPAPADPGRPGRRAAQRFRTPGRGRSRSRGGCHAGDRRGPAHVYQLLLGTPEAAEAAGAAEATEQIGKFLRARVPQPDSP